MFKIRATKEILDRAQASGVIQCLTREEHEEKCAIYCDMIDWLVDRAVVPDDQWRDWRELEKRIKDWQRRYDD